jgi:hypothetical protein
VVAPGFALAPIITCVPDIIISDVENNSQTDDLNFFIFHDALNLDDLVVDEDDETSEIRWSFIETTSPSAITINGIASDPLVDFLEPGANDLRLVSQTATFENVLWTGTTPATDTMQSMITLVASDGTGTDSADIIVTTVNDMTAPYTDGTPDGIQIKAGQSYTWTTSQGTWEWYGITGLQEPQHSVNNALVATQTDAMDDPLVYGSWETSKNPANSLEVHRGCVMRARFALSSSVDGQSCPGFRMRANWLKVVWNDQYQVWALDFTDQDFNSENYLIYQTFDGRHIAGREPGQSGQTYTLLHMPEQTDTVGTTGCLYIALDLVDNDGFPGADDSGAISCSQVDIDWFDNPALGSGRIDYDTTDFSNWVNGITQIYDTVNTVGLSISGTASGISISVLANNRDFEAVSHSPDILLDAGRYYRATYMVTSSQTPGGPFGPTVRGSVASSQFIFANQKDLKGGGLLSAFDSTPSPYQIWFQAPVAAAGSTQTEAMWMIFESYLTANPSPFFPTKTIQGTVQCTRALLESWDPAAFPPAP